MLRTPAGTSGAAALETDTVSLVAPEDAPQARAFMEAVLDEPSALRARGYDDDVAVGVAGWVCQAFADRIATAGAVAEARRSALAAAMPEPWGQIFGAWREEGGIKTEGSGAPCPPGAALARDGFEAWQAAMRAPIESVLLFLVDREVAAFGSHMDEEDRKARDKVRQLAGG